MKKKTLEGSINHILLALIAQRDLHGYEMIHILRELNEDVYKMSEGTLYSVLKRLERKQWIESYWVTEGRRKYYHTTDKGLKELENKRKTSQWLNTFIRSNLVDLT